MTMTVAYRLVLPLLVVQAAVTSCLDPRPLLLPSTDASALCTGCHGTKETNAAPPSVVWDDQAPVDAHQVHLRLSDWHVTVGCAACHVVPTQVSSVGHLDSDLPAEISFSLFAVAHDATPSYDDEQRRCSGVYCHGATLSGGVFVSPGWMEDANRQAVCGDCHSLPPPPPHTSSTQCVDCHGRVVDRERGIIRPDLHINGNIDG